MSFFDSSLVVSKPSEPSLIPRCEACGLWQGCLSPKMPVSGQGKRGVLIVAEAPGGDEDRKGTQLIGAAGRELRRTLAKFDVDLDRDCWKTNSLICRPPENRTPEKDEIDYCRPNLLKTIRDLNPRVIILLGGTAVKSMMAPLWKEDVGPISKWVGWKIPCQKYNTWICPTYHPSYVNRANSDDHEQKMREGPVIKLWFERHLKAAFELQGRPWDEVPDYESEIRVMFDPNQAAKWISNKIKIGGKFAFDYETNRLKTDYDNAEIVCCSVCWNGIETIAYPWVGEAITATKELLVSEHPKIGANHKFEHHWTKRILGVDVVNWEWDTMISAHHLDCREGITSVKFQALVRLGKEDWSGSIRPYLESYAGSGGLNRIREADLRSLLIYCGVDSVCEYKIHELQKQEMKEHNGSEIGCCSRTCSR